jgi:hypothetical protein
MRSFIVILYLTASLLTGCEENMSNNSQVVEKLNSATTPHEEVELLEEFIIQLKNKNTPITISISENGIEIPVQEIGGKLSADLTVTISFDDAGSFVWKPLDNKNIYLLLRE